MGFRIFKGFLSRIERKTRVDIYNEKEWGTISDYSLVYKGEVLISPETGEPIKASDFTRFLEGLQNFLRKQDKNIKLEKRNIDTLLQRMLDAQHGIDKKEKFVLTLENEDKDESGFNPLDEATWNLASEKRIMCINGVRLIKDDAFMSEKEFLHEVQVGIKYNINNKSVEELVESHLNFCFSLYAEKDLEPVFVVNGFSFSKALCDTCRDTEKETLEQIAEAMNYCIGQNLKKYQYKQYFFEKLIPASQEFFIELYFAERYKWRKDVDDLIVAFYSEFEPETREELDKILQASLYLKAHSELIPQIKACFEDYF